MHADGTVAFILVDEVQTWFDEARTGSGDFWVLLKDIMQTRQPGEAVVNVRVILAATYGGKRSHSGSNSPPGSPAAAPLTFDDNTQVTQHIKICTLSNRHWAVLNSSGLQCR